jgi:hypothetical protein
MSSYTPDHTAIGLWLNSGDMLALVEEVGLDIMARAVAKSPVGTEAEGDDHPGLYISSWKIRTQTYGGATHDRAEAIVYNDAPDALYVEFGDYGREPYHVLLRAALEAQI